MKKQLNNNDHDDQNRPDHAEDVPDATDDSVIASFSVSVSILKLFSIREDEVESFDVIYEHEELHVPIKLKKKDSCRCPVCGSNDIGIKGYRMRQVRHSVLSHVPCIIDYKQTRFVCKTCGKTFNEDNPFAFPGEKVSTVTVYNVLSDLRKPNETFKSVADRYFLSTSTVQRIFDAHVDISRGVLPRYIVFDELWEASEYSHDKAPGVLARAPFELQREHHLAQPKIASFRKKARFIAPKGHVLLILTFEAVSIV